MPTDYELAERVPGSSGVRAGEGAVLQQTEMIGRDLLPFFSDVKIGSSIFSKKESAVK